MKLNKLKSKKLLIFLTILGILLLLSVFTVQSAISENGEELPFLLNDGVLVIHGWNYYCNEATSDPKGVEWVTNISIIETITITSLSDSLVKFEKDYLVVVNEAYQKYGSSIYYPTHFTLGFYDEFSNEIVSTPYMTFESMRIVDITTGERIFTSNPYDAELVSLEAHYDYSYYGYPITHKHVCSFDDVGSYSNVFNPNAITWQIGSVVDGCNVTRSGTWNGYDTWVLEYNGTDEDTICTVRYEYEQTSGVEISYDSQFTVLDNYYGEYHFWLYDTRKPVYETMTKTEIIIVNETTIITSYTTEKVYETEIVEETSWVTKETTVTKQTADFVALSFIALAIMGITLRRWRKKEK